MEALRFSILGPMSVHAGAADRTPRPAKLRTLLALLLVRAPNPVPTDALIDGLWDADAPTTASTALQVYVSQLRQILDPGRSARDPGQLLQTSRRGYRQRLNAARSNPSIAFA